MNETQVCGFPECSQEGKQIVTSYFINVFTRNHKILLLFFRNKNWSFLKDFDPRGRPKTPNELSEEGESYFSNTVSPTQGHVYGSRVGTELGEKMAEMEFLFHSANRKCKMDKEFKCC